ncbi:TetR/AcrR family transcriptional regulator [Actinomyces sp. 2119]|uniref:TetR/AcrR family transcriptional regulator n=1 Tax=Actinomyces lilanjuaniae TaxID=2321394 RepID=A0ABN5PLI3_9ACTO|nr:MULTISPECIES: TetR/AcrR family transcriptional regulator [Actinomyces]AYD89200.1 TetR/AcrR family transcriptional regulator [Actinomyces lilanjuaniae]RJF41949.1 TetR/AcrR family transcriptional regulator [Actinomyces sp. 2119]
MDPAEPRRTSHYASRRAHTDAQLAAAVRDLVVQHGYTGLTIEGVAQESGVAKTTIYRRWGSKAEMVFDLILHPTAQGEDGQAASDPSCVQDSIRQLAESTVTMIASPVGLAVIPGLLAEMAGNPKLRASMESVLIKSAHDDISSVLNEPVPHPVNINEFHATLLGVPYVRLYLLNEKDVDRITDQLTDQLLLLIGLPPRPDPASCPSA